MYHVVYQVNEPDGPRQGEMLIDAPSEVGAKLLCRSLLRKDGSAHRVEILRVGAAAAVK